MMRSDIPPRSNALGVLLQEDFVNCEVEECVRMHINWLVNVNTISLVLDNELSQTFGSIYSL